MNRQRRTFIATLVLIWLTGEISDPRSVAAATHYPLWVCGGRYGGWGWSRPAGLTLETVFRAPAAPHGYEYWYPAYSYDSYAYVYPYSYPYPDAIYVHECVYWSGVPR
jgi:hypothetical protein